MHSPAHNLVDMGPKGKDLGKFLGTDPRCSHQQNHQASKMLISNSWVTINCSEILSYLKYGG